VIETLFLDDTGRAITYYPDRITGGLPVGVPGTVAAFALLHERAGEIPWRDCVSPAVELAREGFPVSARLHASIAAEAARLSHFAATRQVFFDGDGMPRADGAWF
jgi:gamma-glutamyltranspeptidase/glutathione hydrolase